MAWVVRKGFLYALSFTLSAGLDQGSLDAGPTNGDRGEPMMIERLSKKEYPHGVSICISRNRASISIWGAFNQSSVERHLRSTVHYAGRKGHRSADVEFRLGVSDKPGKRPRVELYFPRRDQKLREIARDFRMAVIAYLVKRSLITETSLGVELVVFDLDTRKGVPPSASLRVRREEAQAMRDENFKEVLIWNRASSSWVDGCGPSSRARKMARRGKLAEQTI